MRDRVNEAVVLLVTPNLANQKDSIEHQASGDRAEEQYAKEDFDSFAPGEDDPAKAYRRGNRRQADAKDQEENDRPPTAGDPHASILPPNTTSPQCAELLPRFAGFERNELQTAFHCGTLLPMY